MLSKTFAPFAPIDENFAGIEIHIADLDVDELARAYSRIEEGKTRNGNLRMLRDSVCTDAVAALAGC
jgi:hypothetical protein